MVGVVGHQETNQQVLQIWKFLGVAEDAFDEVPERFFEVKLFNLIPTGRWMTQVDVVFILNVGEGMKQCADDGEKLWLVCFHHNG